MSNSPKFAEALPIALLRAREATLGRFRGHVTSYGLTMEQWRVIRALAEHDSLTTVQLSEMCILLPPSLSRMMKLLETRGLIDLSVGKDRRTKISVLTAKGRKLFDEMIGETSRIHKEMAEQFGERELQELVQGLTRLRDVLETP